jgi:hypothetical protein
MRIFLFRDLLNALDRHPEFVRGPEYFIEQVPYDLVAVGGDPDIPFRLRNGADHSRADVRLSRPRRSLNGQDPALDMGRNAHGRGQHGFIGLSQGRATHFGRRDQEEIARGMIRPHAQYSVVGDVFADPHQRVCQFLSRR